MSEYTTDQILDMIEDPARIGEMFNISVEKLGRPADLAGIDLSQKTIPVTHNRPLRDREAVTVLC